MFNSSENEFSKLELNLEIESGNTTLQNEKSKSDDENMDALLDNIFSMK